jgi:hypothetical protein
MVVSSQTKTDLTELQIELQISEVEQQKFRLVSLQRIISSELFDVASVWEPLLLRAASLQVTSHLICPSAAMWLYLGESSFDACTKAWILDDSNGRRALFHLMFVSRHHEPVIRDIITMCGVDCL